MKKDRSSYAMVGTGAVGGLYGAMLQQSGLAVHFLARSDADWMAEHGLDVESPWGNVSLPSVNVYKRSADMPPCDVVCVCLKTTHNHLLPELLPPLLKPGTVILLMQNGLGAEEEAAASFPEARVGGVLCFVCSNKTGPGRIHHVDYGKVLLAAHSDGMEDILGRIHDDFTKAGIPSEVNPSLQEARWRKLVWNIPYNGLSVILDAQTDRMMSDPSSRKRVRTLMQETIKGANACGADIEAAFADELMVFTDKMKPYTPSMKLDFEAGRPMELEYIYRRPLAAARNAGVDLPEISTLIHELEIKERTP